MEDLQSSALKPDRRVLSFLIDREWGEYLAGCGFKVDYLMSIAHHSWPHHEAEMPAGHRFVTDAERSRYAAIVVPLGDMEKRGIEIEMAMGLCKVEESMRLPAVLIYWGGAGGIPAAKEFVSSLKAQHALYEGKGRLDLPWAMLPAIGKNALVNLVADLDPHLELDRAAKLRFAVATAPAWLRHCHKVQTWIGQDFKGTIVELCCGDGALVSYLRSAFGEADVSGICRAQGEADVAKKADEAISVRVGDDGEARASDVILSTDCYAGDLGEHREIIEGRAKRGLISINKSDDDLPPYWEIAAKLPGWTMEELPSHYFFSWGGKDGK